MTAEPREVHPTAGLRELVHQRARLGILTVLGEADRVDVPYLKALLQLTDGNLGRHIEVLAQEELVRVTKGYEGRRPRTWVEITKLGRGALAAEMDALKQLVQRYEERHLRPVRPSEAGPPS